MSSGDREREARRWATSERVAEQAALEERLTRLSEELTRTWAEARLRRSQIRRQRTQLRAQMQLRRAAAVDFDAWATAVDLDGRAAAAILGAALSVSGLTLTQLWLDYVALGGNAGEAEVSSMVTGAGPIGQPDHDRIALALNERLDDSGFGRPLAYWDGSR